MPSQRLASDYMLSEVGRRKRFSPRASFEAAPQWRSIVPRGRGPLMPPDGARVFPPAIADHLAHSRFAQPVDGPGMLFWASRKLAASKARDDFILVYLTFLVALRSQLATAKDRQPTTGTRTRVGRNLKSVFFEGIGIGPSDRFNRFLSTVFSGSPKATPTKFKAKIRHF